MCGRYTLVDGAKLLKAFPELQKPSEDVAGYLSQPHYNIAPGQQAPVLLERTGSLRVELMKWGFIPPWVQDESDAYKMINARSEEIAQKPAYRQAFRTHRCIVPASGFYEWRKFPANRPGIKTRKVPMYIYPKDPDNFFLFAGLYSVHRNASGIETGTFTILTMRPSPILSEIHNRMPVILRTPDVQPWLNPDVFLPSSLESLQEPVPDTFLTMHAVSTLVNSPNHDSPACIQPFSYPDM